MPRVDAGDAVGGDASGPGPGEDCVTLHLRHTAPMARPRRSTTGASGPYRLDELGWLQFQRLCDLLLEAHCGVRPERFSGEADRCRSQVALRPVCSSPESQPLPEPTLVAVMWSPPGPGSDRIKRLQQRLLSLEAEWSAEVERGTAPRGLLLATNLPSELAAETSVGEGLARALDLRRLVVLSELDLGQAVDAHPASRRIPALLGLGDLEELVGT